MLKSSATWEPNHACLDLLAYQLWEIAEKLKKSEGWVVEWSSRNNGFEDKKRTGGLKMLNEVAQKISKKAK